MPKIIINRESTERMVPMSTLNRGETFRTPDLPGVTYMLVDCIGTAPYYAVRLNGDNAGKIEALGDKLKVMEVQVTSTVKDV